MLHDYGLHHLLGATTAWRGDFAGYARKLGYALGAAGVQQTRRVRSGQTVIVASQPIALIEPTLNVRQQLGLADDVFVVECAGQMTIEKRFDLMLKAFA